MEFQLNILKFANDIDLLDEQQDNFFNGSMKQDRAQN